MYALMSYQTALVPECLVTQITSIRELTTMYAMMCYLIAPTNECFITHITSIRALTTMYASMYYKTALLREGPITHFTCIFTLTRLYITEISAFSTVCMKLFIHSALVKTQRLNIRIYSDRKNNYFYSNVYSK